MMKNLTLFILFFCIAAVFAKGTTTNKKENAYLITPRTVPHIELCGNTPGVAYQQAENDARHRYPWTVAFVNDHGRLLCQGALISYEHILTVASCFDRPVRKAVLGAHLLNSRNDVGRKEVLIKAMRPHPLAKQSTVAGNDIGIAQLATPLKEFTAYIVPICLPIPRIVDISTSGTDAISEVAISGFGLGPNKVMRDGTIKVIQTSVCKDAFDALGIQTANDVLCTFGNPGVLSRDDVGSALTFQRTFQGIQNKVFIIGLTHQDARPGILPSVNVKIEHHLEFILETLGQSILTLVGGRWQ